MRQSLALDPSSLQGDEKALLWCEPGFLDMECLAARFRRHDYAPHRHDTYVMGVIVAGAERYTYRGQSHIVPAGAIAVLNPDEWHDGAPVGDGYAYRMFYPAVELFTEHLAQALDRKIAAPHFRDTVLQDAECYARIERLHGLMQSRDLDRLGCEAEWLALLGQMAVRHADLMPPAALVGSEHRAVQRARDYLDHHLAEPVRLQDLAQAAGLSAFHLTRCFRAALGITPHAYLIDQRVHHARRLLRGPDSLADIALACGCHDQPHLTRIFKARVGVTPGHYRRALRE